MATTQNKSGTKKTTKITKKQPHKRVVASSYATNKPTPPLHLTRQEIISIHQFSKIAMVFWIGGSLMIAAVILPLLFNTIDIVTASNLARQILYISAYIGIVCLTIAIIEVIINHKLSLITTKRFWYIIAMATLLIVNNFAIFPMLDRLKQQASQIAHQVIVLQNNVFDFWHSFSAILFIITCIFGILYLIEM